MKLKTIPLLVGYVLNANPRVELHVAWAYVWMERAARYTTENLGRMKVSVPWPSR